MSLCVAAHMLEFLHYWCSGLCGQVLTMAHEEISVIARFDDICRGFNYFMNDSCQGGVLSCLIFPGFVLLTSLVPPSQNLRCSAAIRRRAGRSGWLLRKSALGWRRSLMSLRPIRRSLSARYATSQTCSSMRSTYDRNFKKRNGTWWMLSLFAELWSL